MPARCRFREAAAVAVFACRLAAAAALPPPSLPRGSADVNAQRRVSAHTASFRQRQRCRRRAAVLPVVGGTPSEVPPPRHFAMPVSPGLHD